MRNKVSEILQNFSEALGAKINPWSELRGTSLIVNATEFRVEERGSSGDLVVTVYNDEIDAWNGSLTLASISIPVERLKEYIERWLKLLEEMDELMYKYE